MSSDTLSALRHQHPNFIYEACDWSFDNGDLICNFHFRLQNISGEDIIFEPSLELHNLAASQIESKDQGLLQTWVFSLGMIELLSYWKASCSPRITIQSGYLDQSQVDFWLTVLRNGLSEFFYTNSIDGWSQDFVNIVVDVPEANRIKVAPDTTSHKERCLVPVGGGKDSLVTIELLRCHPLFSSPDFISLFLLNPSDQTDALVQSIEVSHHTYVTRRLDPQLLLLNKKGYLNGHTPFSALLSFVTVFSAWLGDFRYVILSNEQSANEGNIVWQGHAINHQYSKSYEYEKLFRQYVHQHLSQTIEYFSLLRPWFELKIAQQFSLHPRYFAQFRSCNRGKKAGIWCGQCPKCLFVYIMLSAFLPPPDVMSIFGSNLLDDNLLRPILDELTGEVPCKSFECVGLRTETLSALYLAIQQHQGSPLPQLLATAATKILPKYHNLPEMVQTHLEGFSSDHFVPESFLSLLK